jgi:hypothetical protein
MSDQIYINFQADEEIKGKLLDIANANQRSMSAQLRYMIEREWEKLTNPFPETPGYSVAKLPQASAG